MEHELEMLIFSARIGNNQGVINQTAIISASQR